jgi:hypothetical protein
MGRLAEILARLGRTNNGVGLNKDHATCCGSSRESRRWKHEMSDQVGPEVAAKNRMINGAAVENWTPPIAF